MLNWFKKLWYGQKESSAEVYLTPLHIKKAIDQEIAYLERRIDAIERIQKAHERLHDNLR